MLNKFFLCKQRDPKPFPGPAILYQPQGVSNSEVRQVKPWAV